MNGHTARIVLAVAILVHGSLSHAQLKWDWSFEGEAGTFLTNGSFSQTAAAGTFSFQEGTFEVTA